MNWKKLTEVGILEEIKSKSFDNPILIYKHSTRCSVSSMALNRLERSWNDDEMQNVEIYFLDLIAHRDVSNQIESVFGISHESPQVLLISSGECTYDASHMGISYKELKNQLGSAALAQ
tara:strand:+ start:152 stop:508 length:357 start_codon:yes stop_codon:yes gene_type:complete